MSRLVWILLLSVSTLFGQLAPRWSEFSRIPEWEGVLRIGGSAKAANSDVPMTTQEWNETRSLEIRFRLRTPANVPSGLGIYEGEITGSVSVDSELITRGAIPGCITTHQIRALNSSPISTSGRPWPLLRLQFEANGNYVFTPLDQWVKAKETRNTECAPAPQSPIDRTTEYNWWPDEARNRYPLPSEGLVLRRLSAKQIEEAVSLTGAVICTAQSGSALLMKPLLLHASSAAQSPSHRRVIHIEFACASLPSGLRWYIG